jgi:hypothetical protein
MTREETAERIKIMQAYVDGKRIQYAEDDTDVWHNIDEPDWHSDYEYRIKPNPNTARLRMQTSVGRRC